MIPGIRSFFGLGDSSGSQQDDMSPAQRAKLKAYERHVDSVTKKLEAQEEQLEATKEKLEELHKAQEEAASKKNTKALERTTRLIQEQRDAYAALTEAVKNTRLEHSAAQKDHAAVQTAIEKSIEANRRYQETIGETAQAIMNASSSTELMSSVADRLRGSYSKWVPAAILATTVARAWSLEMKAATLAGKEYADLGLALPDSMDKLNRSLAHQRDIALGVNQQMAVLAVRYGDAREDLEGYANELQQKLRLEGAAVDVTQQLSSTVENARGFAYEMRIDVGRAMELIERKRWDNATGDTNTALRAIRDEMRGIIDVRDQLNAHGANVFADDLANATLDAYNSSERYTTSLTMLGKVMETMYTKARKMNMGYRQSVDISKELIHGIQSAEDSMQYLAGRSLLAEAKKDREAFYERAKLSEEQRKQMDDLLNDKSVSDYTKSTIMQERLGETAIGMEATLKQVTRFTSGPFGAEIMKQLLPGIKSTDNAYAIMQMIDREGAGSVTPERLKEMVDEQASKAMNKGAEADADASAKGVNAGASLLTDREKEMVAMISRDQYGASILTELRSHYPKLSEMVEKLDLMLNSPVGVLAAGGTLAAISALLLGYVARRGGKVPTRIGPGGEAVPVIDVNAPGGGVPGVSGAPGTAGPGGKTSGRLGGAMKWGNRLATGAGLALFAKSVYDSYAGDDPPGEPGAEPSTGEKAASLVGTGLQVWSLGSMFAPIAKWGGGKVMGPLATAFPQVGVRAAQAQILATQGPAALARMAGTAATNVGGSIAGSAAGQFLGQGAGSALGFGAPLAAVLASGAAGYGVGTWLDNKYGWSDDISKGLSDKSTAKKLMSAESDEAKRLGMTDMELWQYKYKGISSEAATNMGRDHAFVEFVRSAEEQAAKSGLRDLRTPEEIVTAIDKLGTGVSNHAWVQGLRRKQQPDLDMASIMIRAVTGLDLSDMAGGGPGTITAGGSAAKPGSMVLKPKTMRGDGSLVMEVADFRGVLEDWFSERTVYLKMLKEMGIG